MKKSISLLIHKLELSSSKKMEGGFTVFSNLKGGTLVDPDSDPAVTNGSCPNSSNPSACSNTQNCSGATNNYGCSNGAICISN